MDYGFEYKLYVNKREFAFKFKCTFRATQKYRTKHRPVSIQSGMRHFIVNYGTILHFKGRLASLHASWNVSFMLCVLSQVAMWQDLAKPDKQFKGASSDHIDDTEHLAPPCGSVAAGSICFMLHK